MSTKDDMLQRQLRGRDIHDPEVLRAMENVNRELFVPEELRSRAYEDGPLPIGKSQTISQPYIVALMAQELKIEGNHTILEIGAGCGYNAAVLAQLCESVYSVEIVKWLAKLADKNLRNADVPNVHTKHCDGFKGWPEKAPFDRIVLTAAPPEIPAPLKQQLKIDGILLAPVGMHSQKLMRLTKIAEDSFKEEHLLMVNFVPMTGEAEGSRRTDIW